MLKLGRIKWDADDVDAIHILQQQVIAAESQYRLGQMSGTEYLKALAAVSERVDILEDKYDIDR